MMVGGRYTMNSMTGYGAAEGRVGKGCLFVEIKSVNHRFSEVSVKIPGRMSALESLIRRHLQKIFARGKVDVFIKEKEPLFGGTSISIDTDLARKYQRALGNLKKNLGIKGDVDFLNTVGIDRIIRTEEKGGSYEKLWGQILKLLNKAMANVSKMRAIEGKHITNDQKKRLKKMQSLLKGINSKSKHVRHNNLKKIRHRISGDVGGTVVDEQRLQMEAAMLGGRQDIAEEIVRLESHTRQYSDLLKSREAVGRKLDFLLQEMNREANTIGAKAADAKISQMVVECKAELERLREQVQNVE